MPRPMNPAPIMPLIEVVSTVVTAPEVTADIEALCTRIGKVDVTITDRAGFIANALLFGYLNHAVFMYQSKYVSREDVDAAMVLDHPLDELGALVRIGDVGRVGRDLVPSRGDLFLRIQAHILRVLQDQGLLPLAADQLQKARKLLEWSVTEIERTLGR